MQPLQDAEVNVGSATEYGVVVPARVKYSRSPSDENRNPQARPFWKTSFVT